MGRCHNQAHSHGKHGCGLLWALPKGRFVSIEKLYIIYWRIWICPFYVNRLTLPDCKVSHPHSVIRSLRAFQSEEFLGN